MPAEDDPLPPPEAISVYVDPAVELISTIYWLAGIPQYDMNSLPAYIRDLEEHFGPRKFLRYYFFTGVGAGLLQVLASRLPGQPPSIIVGASGAIFGLLLAYGIVFAERTITLLLFFVLPLTMKAKHLALLLGAVELVFAVSPGSSGIARFAHLGGMAFGYLYLKAPPGLLSSRGGSRLRSIRDRWETARRTSEDRRMDDLLRKVTERGIQSLTEEEKEFLHRMSRRKKWH